MRAALLALLVTASARAEAPLIRVVVTDLAADLPARNVGVRIRDGDTAVDRRTSAAGELELPLGRTVGLESLDPRWTVVPARVEVTDQLARIGAYRTVVVRGRIEALGVAWLDQANVYATVIEPGRSSRFVGSGGPRIAPLGMHTLWRAGIPDNKGRFELRLRAIRGLALFARHGDRFAPVQRVRLDRIPLDQARKVTLPLYEELEFAGTVVNKAGDPIENARVAMCIFVLERNGWMPKHEARARTHRGRFNRSGFAWRGESANEWRGLSLDHSSTDGAFRLSATTDAECNIVVHARGYRSWYRDRLWLDRPHREQRIVLERTTDADYRKLTIDGRTVPNARVTIIERIPSGPRGILSRDREFTIELDGRGRLPTGRFREGRRYELRHGERGGPACLVAAWPPQGAIALRAIAEDG